MDQAIECLLGTLRWYFGTRCFSPFSTTWGQAGLDLMSSSLVAGDGHAGATEPVSAVLFSGTRSWQVKRSIVGQLTSVEEDFGVTLAKNSTC